VIKDNDHQMVIDTENKPLIRQWALVAIMEDGTERTLNDRPFVGDVFDAGEEADRLGSDMGGIESFELRPGLIVTDNISCR